MTGAGLRALLDRTLELWAKSEDGFAISTARRDGELGITGARSRIATSVPRDLPPESTPRRAPTSGPRRVGESVELRGACATLFSPFALGDESPL